MSITMYKLVLLSVVVFLTKSRVVSVSKPFSVRIVGIFVAGSELPYRLELAQPSVEIALEKARVLFPHIHWQDGHFRNGSSRCTANYAGVFAAEEFYLRRVVRSVQVEH